MCKQYRAILALSELGLGEDANCHTRMMLESMLAMQFILRRKVVLKAGKIPLAAIGKTSSRFRADLYMANDAFQRRKHLRCVHETPGFKRTISKAGVLLADENAKHWEARIGLECPFQEEE